MTVRDVKPFVEMGVVPYFMDHKLILATIAERGLSRKEAISFLSKKWMEENGHGN